MSSAGTSRPGALPRPAPTGRHAIPLSEVRAGDGAVAGGKAAHLGELIAAGFPVPEGFVIPAATCGEFFAAAAVGRDVAALAVAPAVERSHLCAELHRRIVATDMGPAVADAILSAHARLAGARGEDFLCAVRSSATAEDLAGASFAGQHGTYYYVGADRLLEMVRRCWASLFSVEAVAYRASRGIAHDGVLMAVVVQEMVPSDVSGVAFTANPVTGDRGELVIEASWGMGAAIVDGRVTPDRFVVGRTGLELRERRIAEKRFMVPTRPDAGTGSRLRPVPHAQQRQEALTPAQVRVVAGWALRCENHFGTAQDVEWAFADGAFHVLQARPVTTLAGREPETPKGKWVLFKAAVENFTDPLTPLSGDLYGRLAAFGFRVVGGRLYMDLDVVRHLLPIDASDEDLAAVALLRPPSRPWRLSPWRLPVSLLLLGWIYLACGVVLRRTSRLPDAALAVYRERCRAAAADPGVDAFAAVFRLWLPGSLLDPIGNLAVTVNGCSLRFVPWLAAARAMLARWAPGLGEHALALLTHGSEGVLSAQLGRDVAELARLARRSDRVRELLGRLDGDVLRQLREEPEARELLAGLDRFLEVHGHRGLKEFELRSPRFADDPTPVLAMVRNQLPLEDGGAGQETKLSAARAEAQAALDRALASHPLEPLLGVRRLLLGHAVERARYYLRLRENSRYYHIMAIAVGRAKLLEAEADLLERGALRCRDDIFFLLWKEVVGLREGRLGWLDVEDRIRERRLEHARLALRSPAATIGVATTAASAGAAVEELRGLCACPGTYEGVVRVVLDPSVESLLPGEVLVAPYTDPAWTPLFLTAGAAVVEVGSYLSHAGTVAREFGMPCVVDVPDCTRRLVTGSRVRVDATSGVVRVLPGDGPP